jgi:hypothetical protein
MNSRLSRIFLGLVVAAMPVFSVACGSSYGGNQGPNGGGSQYGNVNMLVSDASTEDWAAIDVKIQSIALVPQGGGSPVTVYTAPSPAPSVNLVELDQLGEVLGNISVPVGTYTSALLTIGANQGDVTLTAATNPEAGFEGTPGATVPANQIQIMGATGSSGSKTVPVSVNFDSPLVVTSSGSNALDLEFDLSHPAFLVGHVPPAGGGTLIWAVNFNGPVRHHPIRDITRLVLRHMYGNVSSVSSDDTSITITRDFPVEPPTNPETAIASAQSLQILADANNGTLYYDVDAKAAPVSIKNFSTVAGSLPGKFVRIAARYQANGTLVAVRIWASSTFNSVWISPEGHVLHVNTSTDVITVQNELGLPVQLTVDANTEFFFRTPWNAVSDATPIGQGTGFLTSGNFVRGFKIHASVVDPLASPLVAQTIDIEIARFDGSISNANLNSFTYMRKFFTSTDNYTETLPFISSGTANGSDPMTGSAITGFKWWNFTFPTHVDSGSNAIPDFDAATAGGAIFGGTVTYPVYGESFAVWNDPAGPNAWDAPWTVLIPSNIPFGAAATGYSSGSFTMTVPGGANAGTVNLNTTSGSGTLVYQVDRTGGVVTVSLIDITTASGQQTLTTNLKPLTPVKVFGIPQADGTIKAYVVIYFTGVTPSAIG